MTLELLVLTDPEELIRIEKLDFDMNNDQSDLKMILPLMTAAADDMKIVAAVAVDTFVPDAVVASTVAVAAAAERKRKSYLEQLNPGHE